MKIKLITTEQRLTKSIVNQMHQATLPAMTEGVALGYVVNTKKGESEAGLIEYKDDFYCFATNWSLGSNLKSVYRGTPGRWTTAKHFESKEDCREWWDSYEVVRNNAMLTHIYL